LSISKSLPVKADSNFTKDDLSFAWIDLLNSNNEEVVNFAKQLVVYAYYTSGFKKGAYSIHHYIPAKVLKELQITSTNPITNETESSIISFNDFIKQTISLLSYEGLDSITDGVVDEVFQNNWWNPLYVPVVDGVSNMIQTEAGEPGLVKLANKKYILGNDPVTKVPIYKPYILVNVDNKSYLMKSVGILEDGLFPVYKLVGKKGYSNKGRIIKEYGLDKSIISDNNVTLITDEMISKVIASDKRYSSLIMMQPKDLIFTDINTQSSSNPTIIDGVVVDNDDSQPILSPAQRSLSGEANNSLKSTNHAMSYQMKSNENLTGRNTTTLKLAEQGLRTATTRSYPLGKVGDIITFEGRPQQYRITNEEQLTKDKVTDSNWIKQWSQKEQWTEDHFKSVLGGKTVHIGSWQTSFEKVNNVGQEIWQKQGIIFEEEQSTGYRERTIKNASADATIAIAVDFESAGEKLTKSASPVCNASPKIVLLTPALIFRASTFIEVYLFKKSTLLALSNLTPNKLKVPSSIVFFPYITISNQSLN